MTDTIYVATKTINDFNTASNDLNLKDWLGLSKLGNNIFVDSFVIKRELNQFYCLFFFTSNTLGYLKMLEAKWKIDKEDGRGWQGLQTNDLFIKSSETAKSKYLL